MTEAGPRVAVLAVDPSSQLGLLQLDKSSRGCELRLLLEWLARRNERRHIVWGLLLRIVGFPGRSAAHAADRPVTVSGDMSQLGLEGSHREVRTDTRGGQAKFDRTTLRPLYIG